MSTIKVDTIESKTINGDITVSSPLVGDGSGLTNLPSQTANDFTNTLKTKLDNVEANATADQTKTDIEALGIDISGTMSGHIIPGTNSVYDIGSAEYKVRHLFLSDNSLWIGDDHKVEIDHTSGKQKYKKRKKGIVPAGVQTLLITSVFADTAALLINFKAQIHDPAPSNELDPDHVDFNPPTSKWQEFLVLHGHPNKSVDDIYNTATDFDDEKEETDKATTEGDIVYFDGSVYKRLPLGAEGQVLLANGDGTAPEWAAPDGGWVHLATASNSSQTEFTFVSVMDSTYDMYAFVLREVQHNAPNGDLQFQVSDDNGSTYKTSGYHHATRGHDTGGTVRQDNSTNSSSIIIAPDTAAIGNLGFNGVVYLNSLSTYASTHFHGMYRGQTAAANVYVVGCGIWSTGSLGVINAVKFKPSISTFNGSIYCFGITKG